jgi:hypothetical protein
VFLYVLFVFPFFYRFVRLSFCIFYFIVFLSFPFLSFPFPCPFPFLSLFSLFNPFFPPFFSPVFLSLKKFGVYILVVFSIYFVWHYMVRALTAATANRFMWTWISLLNWVQDRDAVYVFGGMFFGGFHASLLIFSFAEGTWSAPIPHVGAPVPSGRHSHAAFMHEGILYIHGGMTADGVSAEWVTPSPPQSSHVQPSSTYRCTPPSNSHVVSG